MMQQMVRSAAITGERETNGGGDSVCVGDGLKVVGYGSWRDRSLTRFRSQNSPAATDDGQECLRYGKRTVYIHFRALNTR